MARTPGVVAIIHSGLLSARSSRMFSGNANNRVSREVTRGFGIQQIRYCGINSFQGATMRSPVFCDQSTTELEPGAARKGRLGEV